ALGGVLAAGDAYGAAFAGLDSIAGASAAVEDAAPAGPARAGGEVMVEFVSANPTGPMHVGHARNAAYGDALARMLEFRGEPVTREYYVNDAGSQVEVF